jgi:hypothetical protein
MRHITAGAAAFIEVRLAKGCVLLLTAEEYDRGVARGKAKRRREAFERRLQRMADSRRRDRTSRPEKGM